MLQIQERGRLSVLDSDKKPYSGKPTYKDLADCDIRLERTNEEPVIEKLDLLARFCYSYDVA
jgi:hypothetical protein